MIRRKYQLFSVTNYTVIYIDYFVKIPNAKHIQLLTYNPMSIKCQRNGCLFMQHSKPENNGGTHCCRSCKLHNVHGELCENKLHVRIDIQYIFSAGFRCYSANGLKNFGLRPFSGPFDFMYIDIETVFKLIHNKLVNFLSDAIVFNKTLNKSYDIPALNELNKKNICYMAHNYNFGNIILNKNYLDDVLSGNLYDWKQICIFNHQDLTNKQVYNNMQRRVARFNKIIIENSFKTCLFHITRILTISNITDYMNDMIRLKQKYSINTYIIIIICCDNLDNTHYFKDSILFIIKKVDSYAVQIKTLEIDNRCDCLDYKSEFDIINQVFNFQLVQLADISE